MPNSQRNGVIQLIRKFAEAECTHKLSDRQLLERFLVKHNEAAFTALIRRHGPMVLRLCRRVLQNEDDAEDAFQATFLVLSRQVSSLRQHESLVGWLHSVAYRVAQKSRIAAARRRKHESRAPKRQVADPLTEITLREAHEVFDQELNKLPDRFRAPLVLCYLQGLTRDEAAQHLGWPPSTLKSRLEQARERLRVRLESRGLALSGALVASLFYESTASATVPCALLGSTVKAAITVAAGKAAAGLVSAKVVALTEGVVKAMFMTKLSVATVLVSGILFVAAAGMLGFHAVAADQPAVPVATGQEVPKAAPPETKREPEDKEKTAREVLAQFEKGNPEWKVRMEALVKLAKAGPAAVPILVEALKNGSPLTREFAAQALAFAADPSTRPALVRALDDPEPGVRIHALKALSLLGPLDPNQEPYRRILAKDAEWHVRQSLAWALERDDRVAPAETRKALMDYDLARIDSARLDRPAPDFALTDTFGKTHRLSDFRGKKDVLLVFYVEKF